MQKINMYDFNPKLCHEYLLDRAAMELEFDETRDFEAWKSELKARFRERLGPEPEAVDPNVRVEYSTSTGAYDETRFVFTSEKSTDVPCYLLVPKNATKPCPVMICLQGHSTGMHVSLGRAKNEGESFEVAGDRDFAIQTVRQGYAAYVIEQRCFGERRDEEHDKDTLCSFSSMVSLLLGRTMTGERIWDVSRAIDLLDRFEGIDLERIGCMGNSQGGKIAYYAACFDDRIRCVIASCSVCSFSQSMGRIGGCYCTYIPGILNYFDMPDMAGLIAPRPLIIVSGMKDRLFRIEYVKEDYKRIQRIYQKAGAPDNCRHVIGAEGHRFYAEPTWPVFNALSGWKTT